MSLPSPSALIPHRGRYLLVDRLERLDASGAIGHKRFEPAEVEGHFPGFPVVPGVLLVEGLAQTLACLHHHLASEPGARPMLAGLDRVRFRAPVLPPAEVVYEVRLGEARFGMFQAEGIVWCGGKKAVTAQLTGAMVPADGPGPA